MRIAYVGNFEPRHSTENHLAATMELLGHEVVRIQENRHPTEAIFDLSRSCDVFFYTRTWGFRDGHVAGLRLLDRLDSVGIPTVSYHLDLYFGLDRARTIDGDPFWRTKYVFTPDGGHDEEMRRAGVRHHYLKPGVFELECVSGTPRADLAFDVVFVGSYSSYHVEWPYRRQLVDWLRGRYGRRFALFGDARAIRNEALNDLYASAKVVVGDSLCPGFQHPNYWSDRVYETVGRGGFLVHPFVRGLEREFADGEHLAFYTYRDFEQLGSVIDRYLADDRARQHVRRQGQAYVRENCTYTQRLQEALAVVAAGEGRPTADAAVAPRPPLRMEIGSGYRPDSSFDVHVDINPSCPVLDYIGPADQLPWPDGAFVEIRAWDVLEHFSYRDTERVLREWRRLLRPGGRVSIQVPDARRIARDWLDGKLRPGQLADMGAHTDVHAAYWLLGGHREGEHVRGDDDWRWNAHFALFSEESLRAILGAVGFEVETIEPINYNVRCWARRK